MIGRDRRRTRKIKTRLNRHKKAQRKSMTRKSMTRKSMTRKSIRRMKGGNYARDITTRTTEGVPTKPSHKFVVTIPGYSAMSGSAYMRLMEDRDRNGNDMYD